MKKWISVEFWMQVFILNFEKNSESQGEIGLQENGMPEWVRVQIFLLLIK